MSASCLFRIHRFPFSHTTGYLLKKTASLKALSYNGDNSWELTLTVHSASVFSSPARKLPSAFSPSSGLTAPKFLRQPLSLIRESYILLFVIAFCIFLYSETIVHLSCFCQGFFTFFHNSHKEYKSQHNNHNTCCHPKYFYGKRHL